jgi:hypothetical protein
MVSSRMLENLVRRISPEKPLEAMPVLAPWTVESSRL